MGFFDDELSKEEKCEVINEITEKDNDLNTGDNTESKTEIIDTDFFWGSAVAPKKKTRRKRDIIVSVIVTVVILSLLMSMTMTYIHGSGWLTSVFTENGNVSLSIPLAERPKIADEYYQSDGRYTVEGIAKAVSESVVSIIAYGVTDNYIEAGQGSGVILTEDGYIATNAHVIDGGTKGIKVTLSNDEEYKAKIIGSDSRSDLAVIKIAKKGLKPIQFGKSSDAKTGEDVVVLGSPAGYAGSVTKGIISNTSRYVKSNSGNIKMQCLQIDAAINGGNSGGAVVNMWGQLIGIVSSKMTASKYEGLGFAITTSAAKPVLEDIMKNGYIENRVRIGITYYQVSQTTASIYNMKAGLFVQEIDSSCDIAKQGLKVGDTITKIDGKEVAGVNSMQEFLKNKKVGETMVATVYRGSGNDAKTFDIKFKLEEDKTSITETETKGTIGKRPTTEDE